MPPGRMQMVIRKCWPAVAVVLLATALPRAWAENPRLAIKVPDATLEEAASQLSKASGIEVRPPVTPPNPAAVPVPANRCSFDWSDITFARALRQLCDRFNMRPNHGPG